MALWLLAWGVPATAWADDLIVSRALLADHTGTLTIEQVSQSEFTPTERILNAGYTATVHWLRLQIKAPPKGQAIELRIRPTYLDEVLLFEPDPAHADQWRSRTTGDKATAWAQDRPSTSLGFSIDLQAPISTVYLRLQTTRSLGGRRENPDA